MVIPKITTPLSDCRDACVASGRPKGHRQADHYWFVCVHCVKSKAQTICVYIAVRVA